MLSESHIIDFLAKQFPSHIGDDAAILPLSDTHSYVITQDILAEGIHFRTCYQDAESLAHKSLQVNLSDIAAMGATPHYVLMSIAIPDNYTPHLQTFLQQFAVLCKLENILLIGGDTTKSVDTLFISITAIGIVPHENLKLRQSAQAGDIIYVAGNLGYAHLGLHALEKNLADFAIFKTALLKPQARIAEGIWLGQQSVVTACMDVSDGLYIDLKKLCAASHVSADIDLDNFTSPVEFTAACQTLTLDPLTSQLIGGEDYGLLFTVRPEAHAQCAADFIAQFGYDLKRIGTIKTGEGVRCIEQGSIKKLELQPFSHFGESL